MLRNMSGGFSAVTVNKDKMRLARPDHRRRPTYVVVQATAPQRELLIDCHIESGRTGGSRFETAIPRCCFSNDITVSLLLLIPLVLLFGRSVNKARARRDRVGELGAARPMNQDFRVVAQLQPVILKQHEARLHSRRQTLSSPYIRAVSRGSLTPRLCCMWLENDNCMQT